MRNINRYLNAKVHLQKKQQRYIESLTIFSSLQSSLKTSVGSCASILKMRTQTDSGWKTEESFQIFLWTHLALKHDITTCNISYSRSTISNRSLYLFYTWLVLMKIAFPSYPIKSTEYTAIVKT